MAVQRACWVRGDWRHEDQLEQLMSPFMSRGQTKYVKHIISLNTVFRNELDFNDHLGN